MSDARRTEIMENNIQAGWTCEKLTAAGTEVEVAKATAGKVAYLKVNGAYDVTLQDHETDKWEAVNNTSQDWSNCPIQCNTSIKLSFSGAGSAWIIYK